MKQHFTDVLRASLTRQFTKLFMPKLPDCHLSRIVMYEAINASADSGYCIMQIDVTREKNPSDRLIVKVNNEIRLDFDFAKEVSNA